MKEFSTIDPILLDLASRLAPQDTVILTSKGDDLKLIVESSGSKQCINIGLEEGLFSRIASSFKKITNGLNKNL